MSVEGVPFYGIPIIQLIIKFIEFAHICKRLEVVLDCCQCGLQS